MATLQRAANATRRLKLAIAARRWPPFSRLFLVSDNPNWVLSEEMRELAATAQRLGIAVGSRQQPTGVHAQSVFYASHFFLRDDRYLRGGNRVAVAYFHGRPTSPDPVFAQCYGVLSREHRRISRVQVSHSVMRDVILESGIDPAKVFLIPIAVNLDYFPLQTPESRRAAREAYGLPQDAVIVGSFQKDGVGWGDGLEPKLIKGPDVFLEAVRQLKEWIPELFVLLSGPARGFVKAGLERLGVPYRHFYVEAYPEVGRLFQALDLYVVASREEGGPKAVLEAMASGVPLVTTRVGQAIDLVQHGTNGWMVEVDDADGLAHFAAEALAHRDDLAAVIRRGRQTAESNSYPSQLPLWRAFFQGFVEAGAAPE
jgi:glycosyltransferase involved in cell wall biosynthesis